MFEEKKQISIYLSPIIFLSYCECLFTERGPFVTYFDQKREIADVQMPGVTSGRNGIAE